MKAILLTAVSLVFLGCGKKLVHSPISSGGTPNPVSNPVSSPFPGGVKITYDPPSDVDFLYAEARYTDNKGLPAKVRSSVYSDTLVIAGFADQKPEEIELFSVNRAGKMSSPVSLTATPGKPPYLAVAESMEIIPYIGSIRYKWDNPSASNIIVGIIADTTKLKRGEELVHTIYTKNKSDNYYQPVGTGPLAYQGSVFAAIVRDIYENRSDTIYSKGPDGASVPKLVALKEFQVKRADCEVISVPGDAAWTAWGGRPQNIFDNRRTTYTVADPLNSSFRNYNNAPGSFPYFLTVKFNKKLQISRFVIVGRPDMRFTTGPNRIKVYGLADLPNSTNVADRANGNPDNWILLQEYLDKSPSGYTGRNGRTITDADIAYWNAGSNFKLDSETAQQAVQGGIQYLRFEFGGNFVNASAINMAEIEFFAAGNEEGETTPRSY